MKVAIVGDTHGDGSFVAKLHRMLKQDEKAGGEPCRTIVQLGDFGFTFDKNMMESIYAWLDRHPDNRWYWLDGNHDQHDYIEQEILGGRGLSPIPVSHFHDQMYYCPRGSITVLGGRTCMFMGGAYSIDKAYRKAGVSWWQQELIRTSDIDFAVQNLADAKLSRVDVLFSHDAVFNDKLERMLDNNGYKVDRASRDNREALYALANAVRPLVNYHGHYHYRYHGRALTRDGWGLDVEGVAANVNQQGWYQDPVVGENVLLVDF